MARRARQHLSLVALLATSLNTFAADSTKLPPPPANASLGTPSPVSRVSGVVQFGMPGDHKYVFCNTNECPDRTLKHIAEPPPPPPLVMPQPVVEQPVIEEHEETPPPKHKVKRHKKHKPVKKKPVKRMDCVVPK